MMNQDAVVSQLRSLIDDAETHRESDGSIDDVFEKDIEALRFAVEAVSLLSTLRFKVECLNMVCNKHIHCSDCPIRSDDGASYLCNSKSFYAMTMEQLDYLIAKIDEAEAVNEVEI